MSDFPLMPFDLTKEHIVLETAMVKALLEFHREYGRTSRKYLDISISRSALAVLRHLDDALEEAGLKIVVKDK